MGGSGRNLAEQMSSSHRPVRRCSFCGEDRRVVGHLLAGQGGVAICGDCARLAVDLERPETAPAGDLILTGIGRLVTNDPRHGAGIAPGAAVAMRAGRITWVGSQDLVPSRYRDLPELSCEGRMVAPGFVDAHRHSVPIRAGAIGPTAAEAESDLAASLEQGTTTASVASWSASSPEEATVVLAATLGVGDVLPVDVVGVFAADPSLLADGSGFVSVALASYLDVDLGAITDLGGVAELVEEGRRLGFSPRFHVADVDALELALDLRAVTVDGAWGLGPHLGALAATETVCVIVPATSWMRRRPDPARAAWDLGAVVALGTGCFEGSVANMPMAMAIAVHHCGLTPAEALWAATRGGALAVEEPDKGQIVAGAVADLVVLEAETPADLVAVPGADPVARVVKDGSLVGA